MNEDHSLWASSSARLPPLSPLELAIANTLRHDVRLPLSTVARIVGVSASYVSRLWRDLEARGCAWPILQPSLSAPGQCLAFIDIVATPGGHDPLAHHLVGHPCVMNLELCDQGRDFVATVIAPSVSEIERRLLADLRSYPQCARFTVRFITRAPRAKSDVNDSYYTPGQRQRAHAHLGPSTQPKGTRPRLGDVEHRILAELARRPRATASELAHSLGVSPQTTQRILRPLLDSGFYHPTVSIAQSLTRTPLSVHWLAHINPARLTELTQLVRTLPSVTMLAHVTGSANVVIGADIATTAQIPALEREFLTHLSGLYLVESLVSLRPLKRWGWPTDAEGCRAGELVVPPFF